MQLVPRSLTCELSSMVLANFAPLLAKGSKTCTETFIHCIQRSYLSTTTFHTLPDKVPACISIRLYMSTRPLTVLYAPACLQQFAGDRNVDNLEPASSPALPHKRKFLLSLKRQCLSPVIIEEVVCARHQLSVHVTVLEWS